VGTARPSSASIFLQGTSTHLKGNFFYLPSKIGYDVIMSDTPDTSQPDSSDTDATKLKSGFQIGLGRILIAHSIIFLLSWKIAFWASHQTNLLSWGLFDAVLESQLWLLAIWGGLGKARVICKIPVLLIACVFFSSFPQFAVMVSFTTDPDLILSFMSIDYDNAKGYLFLFLIIIGAFFVVRREKAKLVNLKSEIIGENNFQFSIRSLIILTIVIALVLAFGNSIRFLSFLIPHNVLRFGVFAICLIPICLTLVWATLGLGRPAPRILLALLLSFCVGLIEPFYLDKYYTYYYTTPACNIISALIVIATLLVVRSWGYRLIPLSQKIPLSSLQENQERNDPDR